MNSTGLKSIFYKNVNIDILMQKIEQDFWYKTQDNTRFNVWMYIHMYAIQNFHLPQKQYIHIYAHYIYPFLNLNLELSLDLCACHYSILISQEPGFSIWSDRMSLIDFLNQG